MKIVNETEYREVIKEGITLVDFFATWCGPCKALGPVLEELSAQYPNIKFVKVDVDEAESLAEEYGIMSVPTVYLLNNGQVIGRTGGYRELESMKQFVDDTVAKI